MTQTEFLLDTLDYYSTDTQRRCTNGYACTYSPVPANKIGISDGCAIGRFLPPELQIELDKLKSVSTVRNDAVFNKLPANLKELGQFFLVEIQLLHDDSRDMYWNSGGLSREGRRAVENIIQTFGLDKKEFIKYLN